MRAFDLHGVQEAGGAPHQQPARKAQARNAVIPTLVQTAGAVGQSLPALEVLRDVWEW